MFILIFFALLDRPVNAQAQFDTVSVGGTGPYANFKITMVTAGLRQVDQTLFGEGVMVKTQLVPDATPEHILLGICSTDFTQENVPIVIKIILEGFTVKALILKDTGTNKLSRYAIGIFVSDALCYIQSGKMGREKMLKNGKTLLVQLAQPKRKRSI